jgi:hypothetical protein
MLCNTELYDKMIMNGGWMRLWESKIEVYVKHSRGLCLKITGRLKGTNHEVGPIEGLYSSRKFEKIVHFH